MFIKRLRVENFKSFRKLDIELGPLNVLVGANASGKSNFIRIFTFLKNILAYGLRDAVSLEGGSIYLINYLSEGNDLKFQITYATTRIISRYENRLEKDKKTRMKLTEISYKFSLNFISHDEPLITQDILSLTYNFIEVATKQIVGQIIYTAEAEPNSSKISWKKTDLPPNLIEDDEIVFSVLKRLDRKKEGSLLIESGLFDFLVTIASLPSLQNISFYDFDTKLLKRPSSLVSRRELEENGENISVVIRDILNKDTNKRKFKNLLSFLLPAIKDLQVQPTGNNSLHFGIQETYSKQDSFLPAFALSDGTVNIIAILIALYFQDKPVILIEEPERNIHPGLISKLMELFKEVAQNKQIILTTHNPQLVKHTDLDSLYLVSRDKEGFSIVTKPGERLEVQTFLENDLGIDDLYVQNLLEGWA